MGGLKPHLLSFLSLQKKFRPPQKSSKYIPKPIPLELGNLKTYSKLFLKFKSNIEIKDKDKANKE